MSSFHIRCFSLHQAQ